MRALLFTLLFSAAATDASAHTLDAGHSLAEQVAHTLSAPHHAVMLLFAAGVAVFALRKLGIGRSGCDQNEAPRRR